MISEGVKTLTFHINGMHCLACSIFLEEKFSKLLGVSEVKISFEKEELIISGDFKETPERVAEKLTDLVKDRGYIFSVEKKWKEVKWGDFIYAVPIASVFVFSFILLQKAGFTNLITSSSVNYGTAFIIGLIASVSSCLAVVGGLVLSMSANSIKAGGTWRPQALFHIGRLVGFFVLGGIIGLIGGSFHLGLTANIILGIIVGLVMLILGINLLDIFNFTKRLQLTMPKFFSKYVITGSKHEHYFAPTLVGVGTFFLPCGFTQSMQLYSLTTGSFIVGALTMFIFALGTFPVLALLSFSSLNINQKPWKGVFFKTAGIIVIILAIFNIINSLVVAGVITPLFSL